MLQKHTIVAAATSDRVSPAVGGKNYRVVVAGTKPNSVAPATEVHRVASVRPIDPIFAGSVGEVVRSGAAVEFVVPAATSEIIVSGAAVEFVVPGATSETVTDAAAEDHVAAAVPIDIVGSSRSDEAVSLRRPVDVIRGSLNR